MVCHMTRYKVRSRLLESHSRGVDHQSRLFYVVVHFFCWWMYAFLALGLVFPYQAKRLAWGTSPKWPVLCWVGCKTTTQSMLQIRWAYLLTSRVLCSVWVLALEHQHNRHCIPSSFNAHFQSLHQCCGTHCHLTSSHHRLFPSSANVCKHCFFVSVFSV